MVKHNALANSELHEQKGIAAASRHSLYMADGSGSGNWKQPFEVVGEVTVSSGDTSTEITGLGEFRYIRIIADVLPLTSTFNRYFGFQVGDDSSYTTSNVYYTYNSRIPGGTGSTRFLRDIYIMGNVADFTGTYAGHFGICDISDFNKAKRSVCTSQGEFTQGSDTEQGQFGVGLIREDKAYTKIKFRWYEPSYQFDTAEIWVLGIRG